VLSHEGFVITNYSNATRGRLKEEESQPEFHIIEDESPGNLNRSWARLIMKIYEVDPLICPIWGAPHIVQSAGEI